MKNSVAASIALGLLCPAALAAPTMDEIETATYSGGALPDGQSALAARVQILLDRAAISPGVIDGYAGGMTQSALTAFEARAGFSADGVLDQQVWDALNAGVDGPLMQRHTITPDNTSGLSVDPLPDDYAKLAKLDRIGHTRASERLAEMFHMDEDFLKAINPDAMFNAGETILVVAPGPDADAQVARIEVHKARQRMAAYNGEGRMIANYPVAIGSDRTPSPEGTYQVVAVAIDPTYSYQPDVNFKQDDNDETLILPPGPNGPVGSVWIDLDKPTFGLHGTAEPAELFKTRSHGCVRMTNWDASELAHMVGAGVTVAFLE